MSSRCEKLWRNVRDIEGIGYLAKKKRPADWSEVIVHTIHSITYDFHDRWERKRLLEHSLKVHGAKLTVLVERRISELRKAILKSKNEYEMLNILRWLSKPEYCEPDIYFELIKTPTMQSRYARRGLKRIRG